MDPEYNNMVFQPGVVSGLPPMSGILEQTSNQNDLLPKPDQPQHQQQQQQHIDLQHQPLHQHQLIPSAIQNNEEHLQEYTTNTETSLNTNLPTEQIIYNTTIVTTNNAMPDQLQAHSQSASQQQMLEQDELPTNQPLENHNHNEIVENLAESPLEQNTIQTNAETLNDNYQNSENAEEQTEVKDLVENTDDQSVNEQCEEQKKEEVGGEEVKTEEGEADTKIELEKMPTPADANDLIEPVAVKQEEVIDENQCRVCLSKDDLVDLFKYDPNSSLRICDTLMKICTTVKITERDYLPHFVCTKCVEKINIAYELKTQCEETDKNLRSKLKRSKKKSRGTTEFLLIDCVDYSSASEDEQNKEDDDFHLSEISMASEADSDESFGKRRRSARNRSRRNNNRSKSRSKPKPSAKRKSNTKSSPVSNKRSCNSVVYIEAPEDSDDEENVALASRARTRNRVAARPRKSLARDSSAESDSVPIQRPAPASMKKSEYKCNYCAKMYNTAEELRDHKRAHVDEKPNPCPICNKLFKQQLSLTAHIQKHKEEDEGRCDQCNKLFPSKAELRKHMQIAHADVFECEKCKRTFTTKPRLDKHKCTSTATTIRKKSDYDYAVNSGRDLFKSVAPLTTTYWSDSFSD